MVHGMFGRRAGAFAAGAGRAGAAALVALACGPSFQAVYEGDQRFEHCYALDESPTAALEGKRACWKEWLARNTYGQTRDRAEYAAARYRALARIHELPTDEAVMQAAPGEATRRGSVTAPAPTSAFAPPPRTLGEQDAGPPERAVALADVPTDWGAGAATPAAPASSVPAAPRPPGAGCVDGCATAFRVCTTRCDAGPCRGCDADYGRCARGCLDRPAAKRR